MKSILRSVTALVAAAALMAVFAGPAGASARNHDHGRHGDRHGHRSHRNGGGKGGDARPVFVQTDNLAGNQIVAYDQAPNGTLTAAGTYDTGGSGGKLEGAVVDNVASQGSLTYDGQNRLLYAVNAGSDTVSVFAVDGDRLDLRQVVASGGSFPVSVTVHDGVVYVLNARAGGSIRGFRVVDGRLSFLANSNRALGLDPTQAPEFVNTPGQVAFTPDGSQLIVTTKANGSKIDVFGVDRHGVVSAVPTVNDVPGTVPFGVEFNQRGDLIVSQAGPNAVATYERHSDGTLTELASVPTGQAATCWVIRSGKTIYVSNAGSGNLSRIDIGGDGRSLTLLGNTETHGGTVDAALSGNSRFLYVQTGATGTVDEFAIDGQGNLTSIGSVLVPGAVGGEGIVAL